MAGDSSGKTAFVLAGGGSFGAIQVGMLRALVAHGVLPDLVVGASVGALNGIHFCCDPTPDGVARLEAIWCGLRRSDVFPMSTRSLIGLFRGAASLVDPAGLRALVERHLPHPLLDDCTIPLHVAATDLLSGSSVLISSGPAVDAVLASCAIPGAFPPVRLGGRYLIDGAIASNTPVMAALSLGCSRLVVLPTGFACALSAPPAGALASAFHALNLLVARQLVRDLEQLPGLVEVATVPPLCPLAVSPYDFSRAHELIERAAEGTQRWLENGGLSQQRIPGALRPHVDDPAEGGTCEAAGEAAVSNS
ncbi:patatin-like phospholipase family protein [Ramlibacter sp.]|uniref:patatin-like phospholipase family protein n=1 Tax=Ramlibacter sp. TaxID=1917967 RepID=UPI002D2745B4|nr:patatin-like phospholipase family protein [Ramlibacter sp.]HYD76484.1 patatin-like phospholipase family protein [Ramlibacter sp.]